MQLHLEVLSNYFKPIYTPLPNCISLTSEYLRRHQAVAATTASFDISKMQLLPVSQIEELFISNHHVSFSTLLSHFSTSVVQVRHVQPIHHRRHNGYAETHKHHLESQRIFWCLTSAKELRTNDECSYESSQLSWSQQGFHGLPAYARKLIALLTVLFVWPAVFEFEKAHNIGRTPLQKLTR